ncbi:sn-glycerol-3-phosphate transport system permease protein UgpA [Aliidongia dinghuensis]|uniref:sn-glycerol-3-phosphate transport system permease protein UgpA n=1 Tax=Aliidongia dinghuensis TaxID=1867774 RepID=A0A8J2YUF3_9PROT|nr:sn-glycerol-3-phosphate ABC transporter permease UgpA [Aliidongia dinghuensis]GGF23439.1 sn-glycerol-3-phosphate transport system permease protein UgpA [Aliidongia dinghuensis]
MQRRVVFDGKLLPMLLVAPQLAVTLVFFFWPAAEAVYFSTQAQDAFGLSTEFVGLDNFRAVFADPAYLHSLGVTAVFSVSVTLLAMLPALLLAVMADRVVRFAAVYKTALMLPYAVAPAIAGVLWLFLFAPGIGIVANMLRWLGIDWNYVLNGDQALLLVIVAAAWKQLSYNFLFFLAGLQAIPKSLLEAASIDGAGGFHRFRTVVLPLLSPTTFFLFVVDVVYAFFETFGVIHAVTGGGPSKATEILIYKVYYDGMVGLDLGGSSAQSVILMVIVIALTAIQFRYVERKVHY